MNKGKINRFVDFGSYATYIAVAVIGLVVNWVVLDKCFVMADDAWYLCLLRDLPEGQNSSGYLLFGNIFNDNIYAIRCACYILNFISGIVFAIGLFCYADTRNPIANKGHSRLKVLLNILLWLAIVFAGQLRIVTCPSLNYITLNQIIMQLSIGLLLIAVSRRSMVAMFSSGFFAAMLIPVMVTNIVALLFIFFFVAVYMHLEVDRKDYIGSLVKNFLVYIAGMILFLAIYFIFVQSITTYIDIFISKAGETIALDENDYGIKFLYKWLHRTMVFYFMQVVMLAVLLHYIPVLSSRMKLSGKWAVTFRLLMYVAVFAYIRAAVNYDAMFFLMLLAFYLFIDSKNMADRKIQLVFLLLMVMPICLSFGTNNSFHDRGLEYMVFVAPLLMFCSVKWWHKVLSSGVLIVYAVELCMSLYSPTWHGDIYAQQKYDIQELGINQKILVDERTYARIETMKPYLHQGDTVWCDTEDWGFVELLNLLPVSYDYNMNRELVDSVGFVFVRKDTRYSSIAEHLDMVGGYDKVTYGQFTLYVKNSHDSTVNLP